MVVLNSTHDVFKSSGDSFLEKIVCPFPPEAIVTHFAPFSLSLSSYLCSSFVQGVMETCQLLRTSSVFSQCHHRVDPDPYIDFCERDICACTHSMDCHCSVFLDYARSCAHEGVILDKWPEESSCSKLTGLFLGCLSQTRSCLSYSRN